MSNIARGMNNFVVKRGCPRMMCPARQCIYTIYTYIYILYIYTIYTYIYIYMFFRCYSWVLVEPLSQFRDYSPSYSYCHWYHWHQYSLHPFQLHFQPLVFLNPFLFLIPDVTWDCDIHHYCLLLLLVDHCDIRLINHHHLSGLDLDVSRDLSSVFLYITLGGVVHFDPDTSSQNLG